MHVRLVHLLSAVAGIAVTATLAAPSAPATTAAHAGADPDAGRPEVGSCHALTIKQAAGDSDDRPAVPCRKRHSLLTVGVPDTPRNPDWDSQSLYDWTVRTCQSELISYFGRSVADRLARSAYGSYLFYPTRQQQADGAEWIRCDVALLGDVRLMELPREPRPTLRPITNKVSQCLAPERRKFARTVCTRPHAYRAEDTVRSTKRTYPSEKQWGRLARRCPARAPYYLYPGRLAYQGGAVHLICYDKTQRREAAGHAPLNLTPRTVTRWTAPAR